MMRTIPPSRMTSSLVIAAGLLLAPARLDCHDWRAKPQLRSEVRKLQPLEWARLLSEFCEETPKRAAGTGLTCKVRMSGPALEGLTGSEFRPEGVMYGRFLSPTSEDAIVSGSSAETHPLRWGGTLLLTRKDGRWIPLSYNSGVITHSCAKLGLPRGRDVLLCEDEDGGMGHRLHFLYLIDFANPQALQEARLVTADSVTGSCVDRRQRIERVDWHPENRVLSVTLATPVWMRDADNPCAVDPGPAPRPPETQVFHFKATAAGFLDTHQAWP